MNRLPRRSALLLAIATALALTGCGGSDTGTSSTAASKTTATTPATASSATLSTAFGSMDGLPGILETPPPWGANNTSKLRLRLRAIGLPALTAEGQVVHIHQHLDVFVAGKRVTVPANLGIDAGQAFISPLHTHDTSGVMHVESPTQTSFSLGQFFAVWGVRLSPTCIGGECASGDRTLRMWVDGEPVAGDPTRLVLDEHQEIVLAFGIAAQAPKPVPSSYDWAAAGV